MWRVCVGTEREGKGRLRRRGWGSEQGGTTAHKVQVDPREAARGEHAHHVGDGAVDRRRRPEGAPVSTPQRVGVDAHPLERLVELQARDVLCAGRAVARDRERADVLLVLLAARGRGVSGGSGVRGRLRGVKELTVTQASASVRSFPMGPPAPGETHVESLLAASARGSSPSSNSARIASTPPTNAPITSYRPNRRA